MQDRIFQPTTTAPYHTCRFMYRGFQISFITVPPQKVVVFESKYPHARLHSAHTVAEAIEWVNKQ